MTLKTPGIHHVTSIVGEPQRNIDFYTNLLGLRLLKVTVNFDRPATYHLYFGSFTGSPGTILTTFPWPGDRSGTIGAGQVTATSFAIPEGATRFWIDRLTQHGVDVSKPERRFEDEVITFTDPDGLLNELVSRPGATSAATWPGESVPHEFATTGFAGVTLTSTAPERTAEVLTDLLGFTLIGESDRLHRYVADRDAPGAVVDIVADPEGARGSEGPGTVHHVAWRTRDDAEQAEWRKLLIDAGLKVTEVRDRSYFKSIYFQEPGGVLFEIATDPPGFTLDEPLDALATGLRLPPWYEDRRGKIEPGLQPIHLPNGRSLP
ncbi:MAG TPA: ring-cleaving dioxygenase [Nitrolancea sp.]|jgi:glyoxalase family protein|nr:ring-cleaving dioxygenase [Nitrolancea sp.]